MDHRLEKFLIIVEHGSFTRAAEAQHISQPALTVAINDLERQFGTRLLNRKRGNFGLTEAGQIVYESALRMRADLYAMKQLLADHSTIERVSARVGLLDSVASLLFSSKFMRHEPLQNLEVKVDNSTRLTDELKYGRLDMAVIVPAHGLLLPDTIHATPLGNEQFVFVGRSEVVANTTPRNINNWLAVNQASHSYTYFSAEFEKLGIVVSPIFYSTSMDLLKTMALQARGIALLPLHFCSDEILAGELAFVDIQPIDRPLLLISPKAQRATKPIVELTQRLTELFKNHS